MLHFISTFFFLRFFFNLIVVFYALVYTPHLKECDNKDQMGCTNVWNNRNHAAQELHPTQSKSGTRTYRFCSSYYSRMESKCRCMCTFTHTQFHSHLKTLPFPHHLAADTHREPYIDKLYCVQHCFICRPSDFTVSEDAGIGPMTVATSSLVIRRSNH
jgi:hypothetical protein